MKFTMTWIKDSKIYVVENLTLEQLIELIP